LHLVAPMRLDEEQTRESRLHGLEVELATASTVHEVADVVSDVGTMLLGAERVRLWYAFDGHVRIAGKDGGASISAADEAHPAAQVIRTRRPLWLQRSADGGAGERVRAVCVLPLAGSDRVIGAIAFAFREDRAFPFADQTVLVAIADRVAHTLDRMKIPRRWPQGSTELPRVDFAKLQILIVGDLAEARELRDALESLGHDAVAVENSLAACRVASDWRADVVFVDADRPASEAHLLADRLRAIPGSERAELVAVTGHCARFPGYDAHVLKPFTLDTVAPLLPNLAYR
jgi:CheY-like chemotaxis protein